MATQGDDPLGAEALGSEHRRESDGSVTHDRNRVASLHASAHGGMVAGGHDVGEREQRPQHGVRVSPTRHWHQGARGERHSNRLSLTAIDGAVSEESTDDAVDRRAVQTVRAGHVAVDEGCDDQIAACDATHLGADLFDHADEFVPDGADGVLGLTPVVPEVRTAHAGQHDPHDRIGGLSDDRVRALAHDDVLGAPEDRRANRFSSRSLGRPSTNPLDHSIVSRPGVGAPAERGTDRASHSEQATRSLGEVDTKSDIREFLTSAASQDHARGGEPAGLRPRHRRVKGLRREEVAMLAGISVEYYTTPRARERHRRLRRRARGPRQGLATRRSRSSHLFDLVRAANLSSAGHSRRRPSQERVRPTVQRLVDSIAAPAYVRNRRLDLLAANTLGFALYAPVFEDATGTPNMARFIYLNQRLPGSSSWTGTEIANDAVAILRAEAGRDPYDKRTSDLIGELSTRSDEFRVRWAAHNVKFHRTGTKVLHHPVVGDLTLDYEALELPGDAGQRILVYNAEPASPSAEALDLLASWAATPASPQALDVTGDTRS